MIICFYKLSEYENKADLSGCPWYKYNPEPYIRVIIIALEIIFVAASTDVAIIVVCLLNKQLLWLQTFSSTLLLSLSISFYLFLQTL